MRWTVEFTRRAAKKSEKLSIIAQSVLFLLIKDLEKYGPFPGKRWSNYSKLYGQKNSDCRHCHLIKGKPTYVCCWEVVDQDEKLIEVYYVWTHENAPY